MTTKDVVLDRYCGSAFWNSSVTWNTQDPDFTECFEKTALLWSACGFLWITAIFDIYFKADFGGASSLEQPSWQSRWTRLGVFKIFNIAFLICLEVGVLCVNWFENVGNNESNIFSIPDVLWTTPLVLILTHFLSALLIVLHKTRCVHTSGIQLLHWILLTGAHLLIFRTEYVNSDESSLSLSLLGVGCAVMIIQSICFCWSDIPDTSAGGHTRLVECDETKRPECPMVRASCLSYILFSWCTPLVRQGNKTFLKKENLWELIGSIRAKPLMKIFEKHYGRPKFGEYRGIYKNILRPIWNTCGWFFLIGVSCRLISNLLEFGGTKLMGFLIEFVQTPSMEEWKGYMWAVILFLNYSLQTIILEQFYLYLFKCFVSIMICLNLKIYKKSMRISNEARKDTTTGEIVNLMSVDVEKIREFVYMADAIWTTPILITVGTLLLWLELGVAVFAGLIVLCSVIPINWILTTFTSKYQRIQMEKKDERIKILNEVLSGIQVIKLYAWEPSFQAQVQKVRKEELGILRKRFYLQCLIELMFDSIPFLVSMAAFLTFIYMDGNEFNPKRAFTAMSMFNLLTDPITSLPSCISLAVDASVSLKRVNTFLNAEEINPEATKFEENLDEKHAVEIKDGNFSWEAERRCLTNINLSIERGKLTAIVGSVASGKSSLLAAMLGDMKKSGEVVIRGSIAYVPQIAWILNGTLRENICFGLAYDKEKYENVIDACCLALDMEILPAGDMTEIGEKGINLSGGQKQRVSLARAAYSGANILLLDDVLSAVDAHVGKAIFSNLLGPKGLLGRRTRILCTHSYNFLSQVDCIVVMNNGEIVETGTYDELVDNGGNFSKLLSQDVQSNPDAESVQGAANFKSTKKTPKTEEDGKLIEEEHLETGYVKMSVFSTYLGAIGYPLVFTLTLFFAASQGMSIGRSFILAKWTQQQTGNWKEQFVIEFSAFGLAQSLSCLLAFWLLVVASLRASKKLHSTMLSRILRAPMSFFNVTPLGRIVNRFSSDMENLDKSLPNYVGDWANSVFRFLGTIMVITYTNVYFLGCIIPLSAVYYLLQKYYIICMQQLQRIMSALKSPMYSQFSETLAGTSTIRAYRAQDRFSDMLADKIDNYNRALFPHLIVRRWLSIRLGLLGGFVILVPSIFAVVWRNSTDASTVGLSITYALQITALLSWLIKCTSYIQYNFVSVERILEYSEIEQEAELENPYKTISTHWPENGSISFNDYETRYRPGLDPVLKHFSCKINPGEKIGIVGRTGAGKSSLTLALFRIIEAAQGEIIIDGVNIATLGLHDVRRRLTVIPQDPVLFSRPLRLNLDPFEEYTDAQLWDALELAHLKAYVESQAEGLDYPISEGGENLSVGQRQLVCLARAILRKSSILILDEATASVDSRTDELIQETIRSSFVGCTILNVAHRLKTVMDSNKILVLNRGELIEFDTPHALLSNPNSHFYGMAKDAGIV